ncbi:Clp protease N-terminal domain-containing protein [Carbonactinospora thermoautotrophica]|uniref:Clp protease N-terminal domain-containing protein n=1 Tax=Carbonactinospora thermoautotrophica TaxID=1469144 RepID=UPI00226D6AA1|nr:Clp protease N-terminal domain-containing protein [Carbonactinospora thermoautotrophica]
MALPDLDALIAEVDRTCPSVDWIDRLTTAAEIAARLQTLGDDLITEFVEHARFAGRSWAEIGAALGVTRQAAQQRFRAPFTQYERDRFSDELQRAMTAIKQQAVQRRHNYIGTEHVLLGLLAEPNTATELLESLGADPAQVRTALDDRLPLGASQAAERIAWTPYARKVLALAEETATARGVPAIGCDHVLIGILRLGRGLAADILAAVGVTATSVKPRSNPQP